VLKTATYSQAPLDLTPHHLQRDVHLDVLNKDVDKVDKILESAYMDIISLVQEREFVRAADLLQELA